MSIKDLRRKIDSFKQKADSAQDKLSTVERHIDIIQNPGNFIDQQKDRLINDAFNKITGLSIDNPAIAIRKVEEDTTPETLQYPHVVPPRASFLEFRMMERSAVGDNVRSAIKNSTSSSIVTDVIGAGQRDLEAGQTTEGIDYNKTIKLFVPNGSIKTTYNLSYNEREKGIVTRIISNLKSGEGINEAALGSIVQGVANKAIDGSLSAGIFGQFGLARNPNLEILFTKPEFRTFNFTFNFLPSNERESKTVEKIIDKFKYYSHPEALSGGKTNAFWKFPDVFMIRLVSDLDTSGRKIPFKTKQCVLTSIDVAYENSEGKFEQYHDGYSTQINLTMSFQEIVTLTRQDIKEGY